MRLVKFIFTILILNVPQSHWGKVCSSKVLNSLFQHFSYPLAREENTMDHSSLIHALRFGRLDPQAMDFLEKGWPPRANSREFGQNEAEDLILFLTNLKRREQIEAVKYLDELLRKKPKHRLMVRFSRISRWNKNWHKHYTGKYLAQLRKESPNRSQKELERTARDWADTFMISHRRQVFACTASSWNGTRLTARRQLMALMVAAGYVSSTYFMWSHNRDEDFSDWGGRYAYEVIWGFFKNFLVAAILSKPQWGPVGKGIAKYGLSRSLGLPDSFVYHLFLNSPHAFFGQETRNRFDALLENPERAQILQDLVAQFEKDTPGLLENFWDTLLKTLSSESLREMIPDNLTREDMGREEIKEAVMAIIAEDLYRERRGDYIVTGNHALDRYVFDGFFGPLDMPRLIGSGLFVHYKMCMGLVDRRHTIVGLAFFIIDKLIHDKTYFYMRQLFIGQ